LDPLSGDKSPPVAGQSPLASTLSTHYACDEMASKVSLTDAEGRIACWLYDASGLRTTVEISG